MRETGMSSRLTWRGIAQLALATQIEPYLMLFQLKVR